MLNSDQSPAQRLDSWKAISTYLGRDERTVRRWEKELGLPVRRVQGRRGHSVFAYVAEVEAWLQSHRGTVPPDAAKTITSPERLAPIETRSGPTPVRPAVRGRTWSLAAVAIVVLSLVAWRVVEGSRSGVPAVVEINESGVTAVDAAKRPVWQFRFPSSERVSATINPAGFVSSNGTAPGIFVVTGGRLRLPDGIPLSSQILRFRPDGQPDGMTTLEDEVTFGQGPYSGPWTINDARFDDSRGSPRIAVVAHHLTWWPGMAAVFDAQLRRTARFVNSGWVEFVKWAAPNRLLVSGFSNSRDGGMVALLDPDVPDAQSPETPNSAFACSGCGPGRPVRYIVLPRSELNRVTGSGFNRARLDVKPNRVFVHTDEVVESYAYIADAVYEFTPSLDLVRATYSDRYWDAHRALEMQGKITHSREQCPDRAGPQAMLVWEPTTGWRSVPAAR